MLGDDLAAMLPELRRQAESRMRTPCVVRRPGGTEADPVTGADVTAYSPVWSGVCRLQARDVVALSDQSASATVASSRLEVHLPVSAGPFVVGDEVLADGRAFRVDGLHRKQDQTAQRLPVTETTS